MSILHTRINIGLSFLTLLGTLALLYFSFLENVIPIERHRLIAVEGLGIGSKAEFIITREFCLVRSSEAEAIRVYRRIQDEEEAPDEVHEQPPMLVHLEAGCNIRSRRTPLPAELRPGVYSYAVALRFCNQIGRCQAVRLPGIAVTVIGTGERRVIRARPIE